MLDFNRFSGLKNFGQIFPRFSHIIGVHDTSHFGVNRK